MKTKVEFMRESLGYGLPRAPGGIPTIAAFADWDYYYLCKPISWTPEGDAVGGFNR